jgi:uncharacterized membrane protein
MYFNLFIGSSLGFVVIGLAIFAILQWFHVAVGSFLDWAIAGASFWWLLVIVTVPWNVHFQAKEVLAEAAQSQAKGIAIDEPQRQYVGVLARRSLFVAIALHIISTIGLYILAAVGISAVGYISSGAALLLTILRPAIRAYEYLSTRLNLIRQEWTYPREDVVTLRQRVQVLEEKLQEVANQLNPEANDSLAANYQRTVETTRQNSAQLAAAIEDLRATNQIDHDRLSRESRQAIAQLSTDGQFLDHVREIIRFFKTA